MFKKLPERGKQMSGRVFVTGGAGYIGSHTVKALGERGYRVLTYDSLVTGDPRAVLYGELVRGDLLDAGKLREVIGDFRPDAAIHFAAHIVVPESVSHPLKYYINNVQGSLNLLSAMAECGVRKLLFSSSAAVYGVPERIPVSEDAPLLPVNPYGHTKAVVEQLLKDLSAAGEISYLSLRYFNVAGAARDGRIGEGKEDATHLITLAVRSAAGKRPFLSVFGTDYPTPDGSCIRDYIHVEDLAEAHLLGLQHLLQGGKSEVFNCGYGKGYSVLEVIETARKVTGVDFPVKYEGRRPGDPPVLVADAARIRRELGWQPCCEQLEEIICSAWKWEQKRRKQR